MSGPLVEESRIYWDGDVAAAAASVNQLASDIGTPRVLDATVRRVRFANICTAAVRRFLPEVRRQRCTVHLVRNVMAKVPRRLRKRVAREVATVFKAPSLKKAKKRLAEIKARWTQELPEAMEVLQRGFGAATQFYAFPEAHWPRLRTTNGIERLHGEIKRRIRAVGAFPDRASALRLITAVALRVTETWGKRRYLDLSLLESKEVSKAA